MKKVIQKLVFIMVTAVFLVSCSSDDDDTVTLKTINNLKEGIAGETGANAKYLAYSEKAEQDGYLNISKMFKAAAAAEAVHIKNHNRVLTAMGEPAFSVTPDPVEKKSTRENIQSGIDGETYEFTIMYPAFLADAQNESKPDAVRTFTWAKETEQRHAELYAMVLNLLTDKGDDSTVSREWYVCPICGNLHYSIDGVDVCEFCGTSSSNFEVF